jgi:hypothetical protein
MAQHSLIYRRIPSTALATFAQSFPHGSGGNTVKLATGRRGFLLNFFAAVLLVFFAFFVAIWFPLSLRSPSEPNQPAPERIPIVLLLGPSHSPCRVSPHTLGILAHTGLHGSVGNIDKLVTVERGFLFNFLADGLLVFFAFFVPMCFFLSGPCRPRRSRLSYMQLTRHCPCLAARAISRFDSAWLHFPIATAARLPVEKITAR